MRIFECFPFFLCLSSFFFIKASKKYSELLLSTVRQKVERRGRGRAVKEEEEWREKEENGKEEGKCLLVSPFFYLEGLAGRV